MLLFIAAAVAVRGQKIFCTDRRSRADVLVFVVDREYKADLIVYRTDREYRAGWKNEAKRYLLY